VADIKKNGDSVTTWFYNKELKMRMSIINLLYVLYIKLVNEISPLENNPKNVWLYYKKKKKN